MALYRDGAFVAEEWIFPAADDAIPSSRKVAVDKARFLAERDALLARNGGLGLVLVAGDTLAGIEDDLARFELIVLRFLRYADGRPYSVARALRDTHGYRGELRASGDVLRDQVVFLLRSGFDSLDVTHPGTEAALRDGSIVAVRRFYQPASPHVAERGADGPSWRRRAVAS
jgi:uncharacterized protein (DUF934 family)